MRMYVIERRRFNGGSQDWQLAGTSYNPEATLKNEPTGVKVDYQIRASNAAGTSCSTNTMAVVL